MTVATRRRWYLLTAATIASITSIYSVWRYLSGVVPGEEVFRLYNMVTAFLVVSWVVTDPRIPATQRPSFDHGMFVWATFPLLAAYHMYSAHRWRGLFIVLGLIGFFAAPSIALALASVVA